MLIMADACGAVKRGLECDFKLIKQGAEGKLYKGNYLGRPAIVKERFKKRYRHVDLDNHLTKERMKSEARALLKCKLAGNYLFLLSIFSYHLFQSAYSSTFLFYGGYLFAARIDLKPIALGVLDMCTDYIIEILLHLHQTVFEMLFREYKNYHTSLTFCAQSLNLHIFIPALKCLKVIPKIAAHP
jgi:TP53 regulating kinase-like protein